jgi:hypothetical protein
VEVIEVNVLTALECEIWGIHGMNQHFFAVAQENYNFDGGEAYVREVM